MTDVKSVDFNFGNATEIDVLPADAGETILGTAGNDDVALLFTGTSYFVIDGGGGRDRHSGTAGNSTVYRFSSLADSTQSAPDVIINYPNGVSFVAYKNIDLRPLGVTSFSQLQVTSYLDQDSDPYVEVAVRGTNFMFIAYTTSFDEDDVLYVGETSPYEALSELMQGTTGDDSLSGGTGNDSVYGGEGNDTLSGGDGTDFLQGNMGNDSCDGGEGGDTVRGGKDNDTVAGGNGNDLVAGDFGEDRISGGNNADTVRGGKGNDSLSGGSGSDTLWGDLGNDTLSGGAHDDIFAFQASSGVDVITDFEDGTDRLQIASAVFATAAAVVAAFSGGVLNLGGGNSVTITGLTTLDTSDVIIG